MWLSSALSMRRRPGSVHRGRASGFTRVLGMQVVLEDYVCRSRPRGSVSVMLVKLICYGLAALAIVSTLIVTLGG